MTVRIKENEEALSKGEELKVVRERRPKDDWSAAPKALRWCEMSLLLLVKSCRLPKNSKLVTRHVPPPPITPTRLPETPWHEVALDLLSPLPGGEYLIVVVDYFSRWMEKDVIRSTSSATIVSLISQ